MGTIFRLIAVLALVGLAAFVGVNIYNAGVTAGLAEAASHAVGSGATPVLVYPGAYVGQPFGFGFFLLLFFGFFLVMGMLRAAFGRGRWGGGGHWKHRGGPREYMDEWHRRAHGDAGSSDQPA
jgi:hypothetical protein